MRVAVVVIDSFGIGEAPDAEQYGDRGSNTALHICQQDPSPKWPTLKRLGLGNAGKLLGFSLPGCEEVVQPMASFGVMQESSIGKDTTTGHWEIAGVVLEKPFQLFKPDFPSFPQQLVEAFVKEADCGGILGNRAASGTLIIEELGEEHLKTGFPICYTSADSVFQIACHKEVYPVKELYRLCTVARKLCDDYQVGRVIARPFEGEIGHFVRSKERNDYSMPLPYDSILSHLQKHTVETLAVGKIGSIFNEEGIDVSYHDTGNEECLHRLADLFREPSKENRFIFTNLVDTDMNYGHRRDSAGYQAAVEQIDATLNDLLPLLREDDYLIITADHGCDPTFRGTDHTREYVPLLCYNPAAKGKSLGVRESFADVAHTAALLFKTPPYPNGKSFLEG